MAYQIDGDEEQNGMEAKNSSLGQTGDLGMRSKVIKFRLPCQILRFFVPNFVCVLTNERYKTEQTRFSFCHLGWDFGALEVPRGSNNYFFFHTWSCGISNRRE